MVTVGRALRDCRTGMSMGVGVGMNVGVGVCVGVGGCVGVGVGGVWCIRVN